MNEVITKLYEIEETAGTILENTRLYKEQQQLSMAAQQKGYEKEMKRDLEKKLARTKEQLDAQAKEEIDRLQEQYAGQIQRLDEKYDGSLEEMAEEIFQRMIEVQ